MSLMNPYTTNPDPGRRCTLEAEWARTGFRRSLVNYPWFVDAKSGEIVVSERDGHRLQIYDCVGNETRFEPFGHKGDGDRQFMYPGGVTTTSIMGANVIVADTGNSRVCTFRIATDKLGYGVLERTSVFGQQMFSQPTGLEVDLKRHFLVVSDPGKRRVTMHDLRNGACIGELQQPKSCPLLAPIDVTLDDLGRVYVSDANDHYIHVYDSNGQFITKFGGFGQEPGQFNKPWGVCFDREFNLLVSDEGNNRIQMFAPNGQLIKVLAEVPTPKGLSVNIHENLVVATGDPYNFLKILKYK